MEMHELSNFALATLEVLAFLFIFILGAGVITFVVLYVIDSTQKTHAIRHNYPVIGRFRYLFEHLGEFFRQYFFALDREELPFNRAERSWVYRAAKDIDSTVAFGSTRDLTKTGTVVFGNCPFPKLSIDSAKPQAVTIGPDSVKPYTSHAIFNISGMSYGAISKPAVLALSKGAKLAGSWLNTGEGGLSPYHLEGGADLVFQIGTAKYGVRDQEGNLSDEKLRNIAAHDSVKMFELKLAQGAKPGKGGILPGEKVTEQIAEIRGIPIGTDSISPNRHIDINSVDDLLGMMQRIKSVTGKPVGFKTVIGAVGWLDELLAEIKSRNTDYCPDFITIDSGDGGTGAAPMSLMDNVGLPIRQSLPLLVNKLQEYELRERIKVIASGKLITPVEVAWAFAAGADFVTSARGFMFSLGCIQALQCNKNTCPTGITTHDKDLQGGLDPENKSIRVRNYVKNMVYEVGVIAHSCGVTEPRQLRRHHAFIINSQGQSIPLNELYARQTETSLN